MPLDQDALAKATPDDRLEALDMAIKYWQLGSHLENFTQPRRDTVISSAEHFLKWILTGASSE